MQIIVGGGRSLTITLRQSDTIAASARGLSFSHGADGDDEAYISFASQEHMRRCAVSMLMCCDDSDPAVEALLRRLQ